ncbi:alpha/beta fold hydrolase [Actinokineospora pegani]|uniref:alpha/beta fold hydrolase n=1 Tax=Actinokineospora pegani TaxID=2654637 RepID=UPI0012EA4934|nr:alpha/beta hydrolase [Actinokineospora pegani]
MPHIERPDGARIHYEVRGTGFPVLLLAPGGPGGEVADWAAGPLDPATLHQDFQVVSVDQRHSGASTGPLTPYDYGVAAEDLVAVLDALDIPVAHVVAGGQSASVAWRLAADAPRRVRAVVAVAPAGRDETNALGDFLAGHEPAMRLPRAAFFDDPGSEGMSAVLEAARRGRSFAADPEAGPFARTIAADPAAVEALAALRREKYISALVRHRDGVWPAGRAYFSVADEWFAAAPTPVLVLPGSDRLSPAGAARRLAADLPGGRLLADWAAAPAAPAVTGFLAEHSQN